MLRVGSKQLFHNQHTEVSISVSFMDLHVKAQVIMNTCTSVSLSKLSQTLCEHQEEQQQTAHAEYTVYVSFIDFFISIF